MFDALFKQREQIEREFGGPLTWERLDDKRASQILVEFREGGTETPDMWPRLHEKMIDTMIRFYDVLRPRVLEVET